MNYTVTGSLRQAATEIDRAMRGLPQGVRNDAEEKLYVRLLNLRDAVDRTARAAQKLIPDFKDVPNQRDEDKRAQVSRLRGGAV